MEFFCKVCDKIIENYSINNPNIVEIDKIFNDCVTSFDKKFVIYAINCGIYLVFDNSFKIHIETYLCLNVDDLTKIKSYLLCWIDYLRSQGYGFCNITEMIFEITTDKHYITHKQYMNQPMQIIERRLNFVIDRCPQLINALDRSKNHPLIRNYSHMFVQ